VGVDAVTPRDAILRAVTALNRDDLRSVELTLNQPRDFVNLGNGDL
jgi:hypothetical protein